MAGQNNLIERVKNFRFLNIVCAFAYVWFYDFIFREYIVPVFHEPYSAPDWSMTMWLYFAGILPMYFYKGLTNIASVFSLFVYVFAYVPFNETLSVCGYGSDFNDYRAVFFIAMCMFFISDNKTLFLRQFEKRPKIKYNTFENVSLVTLLVIVLLNIRNLHLTNFLAESNDLYDLRANLKVVGGTLAVYLIFWFKNAILPILLIANLQKGNKVKILIMFFAFIFIFMIDQQKLTFVAPFAIMGLWNLYKFKHNIIKNGYHIIIMGALIFIPYMCYIFKDASTAMYAFAALIIMRTQCIEGMELNTYFNWFGHSGTHPYTYYNHINIINAITDAYPYNEPIGYVVTQYTTGSNANGMLWLMDGIAAGGLFGCIFISIIFIIVKSLFNGIAMKIDVSVFAIISTFAMASVMNVSLFTALLSCGLIVMYLLFSYVDLSIINSNNN